MRSKEDSAISLPQDSEENIEKIYLLDVPDYISDTAKTIVDNAFQNYNQVGFHITNKKPPSWLVTKEKWFLKKRSFEDNKSKNFFIAGLPFCIKNNGEIFDETFDFTYLITDKLIKYSYPLYVQDPQSKVMVFYSLSDARQFVRANRIGNLYSEDECFQSAIYEVQILDQNKTSSLKQGITTIKESIPDEINFESNSSIIYLETSLDNLKPISARLCIDNLNGNYEHHEISMIEVAQSTLTIDYKS